VKIFRKAGNDMELLYRQSPPDYEKIHSLMVAESLQDSNTPPRREDKNPFGEAPQPPNPTE
jgi:biopolymer transport protein ExbB